MKYYLYVTKNNKNYNLFIYLFHSVHGAHHNTKHDFFSQCMLNERVMILCVVWKGFRHLPEILGEGVAPDSRGVVIQEREREELLKRQKPTCVATVWWRTSESQKERVRERNRKFNYHEAHLKLNLRRSDPTAGDWHTLDGLCSITGEIHTYTHATCVMWVFISGIILLLTAILQDKNYVLTN